jgi:hypothetical protein
MSYLLPYFPTDARFLGITNNFNDEERPTRMVAHMTQIVAAHDGPIYALTQPPGKNLDKLAAYGLERTGDPCPKVTTNLPADPVELCRVRRTGRPPPPR